MRRLCAPICLGVSLAATAATAEVLFDTVEVCTQVVENPEISISRLAELGWNSATSQDLSDRHKSGLAMVYLTRHALGTKPATQLQYLYELQLKTVSGLLRKVDIPPSRSAYFIRTEEDPSVLLMQWNRSLAGVFVQDCLASLDERHLSSLRNYLSARREGAGFDVPDVDFVSLKLPGLDQEKIRQGIITGWARVLPFNADELSSKIGTTIEFGAALETGATRRQQ